MINKRLLIKHLLTHSDENSFYDKKLKLSLDIKEGKAKFIKHVCALSNSNPDNNSFIIVGVKDSDNFFEGVDFFDDSKIQNLVDSYLENPPKIAYENISFPRLPRYKVIGLVTIYPKKGISKLAKFAWKYPYGTVFFRKGSTSQPVLLSEAIIKNSNKTIVEAIEKIASNNIKLTLDGVFDFINRHKNEYNPKYKVFKEQFVLCWAGKKETINGKELYSTVDIELVNEQVRLFYSSFDKVEIKYNEDSFIVIEYIKLGLNTNGKHYPLEKTVINFKDNGKHNIAKEYLFEPPIFDRAIIKPIYERCNTIVSKIENSIILSNKEKEQILQISINYLICYLNGFIQAKKQLKKVKLYIKNLEDKTAYIKYKEVIRILRKVKYH